MNKTAIKNFAVWARRELIEKVAQRALLYGIEEKKIEDADSDTINGKLLTPAEKKQRIALINKIEADGFNQIIEEVAYTWFNRFIALRFMEVNDYLPSHIRVFSNDSNEFKPQILSEAINIEFEGLDKNKVFAYKNANDDEGLYKYLIIAQCNALNSVLPGLFQKIEDYSELLFPDFILRDDSVLFHLVNDIDAADFEDAVQIIGWLYQYYNTEPKDQVFADLKKNIKLSKDRIPAATQLFTPDWIVRYMVENSLGRLWNEGHATQSPKAEWKYYMEEAEQTDDVKAQLAKIRSERTKITPEQIKCIDPCMGSGHILCYMFDVLMQIYQQYGYSDRDAVASIVQNNIYGLDIDERAAQLAYFAVMMKACQYDKRFLTRNIQPKVYEIHETWNIDKSTVAYFVNGDATLEKSVETLVEEFKFAKDYGSTITVSVSNFEALYNRIEQVKMENSLYAANAIETLLPVINAAFLLSQKYDAVITNPPYMSNSGMNNTLNSFIRKKFPDSKGDMSTVFMEKTLAITKNYGFMAMINIPVWMFINSYEKLRIKLLKNNTLINMVHNGRGIFGSDFGSVAFVFANGYINDYKGTYSKLFFKQGSVDSVEQKEKWFLSKVNRYTSSQENFYKIPGFPIAYWITPNFLEDFQRPKMEEYSTVTNGMFTCNNNLFLRFWYEVSNIDIYFNCYSKESSLSDNRKWYPYNKGGEFRRWYGNQELIINFRHFGEEVGKYRTANGQSGAFPGQKFYFQESLSWSFVSSAKFGIRYYPKGFVFDIAGSSIFVNEAYNRNYFLGLLASEVIFESLNIMNPTINFQAGDIRSLPVIISDKYKTHIINKVQQNISLSKSDWDSFETSWDFVKHPLIQKVSTIKTAFENWQTECDTRFNQLKENEEELNRIFIEIYGLQDELTPEVEDKDVTVRKADLTRDIKSFISYAVGCMLGRYSLDKEGLVYAGGEFDSSNYKSFAADKDAIIPICDDDGFADDIVSRFEDFVTIIYGKETLEENLRFIADALGGNGTSREVIRNYFINGFYKDHIQVYQKRPIYWLFDSGKNNGFKCLVYMHRYKKDTIARIRTDYVHERQGVYNSRLEELNRKINESSGAEKIKYTKLLQDIKSKADELHKYEEKIHHLADQMIEINLDDGVKHNYEIFKDVLAALK